MPSMDTVKVWSEVLAVPTTFGPVWMLVLIRPTDSAIVVCAGQKLSGTHWTTLWSSHSYLPVITGWELILMARSAEGRSDTGAVNVTTTGWATPTTWSGAGRTDAMSNGDDWLAAALRPAGLDTTLAAVTIAAS